MGTGRTDEFRNDAVRIALTSGLSRRQVADDLGVGLSTLNKWGTRTATRMWCRPRIASWRGRTKGFGARTASSSRRGTSDRPLLASFVSDCIFPVRGGTLSGREWHPVLWPAQADTNCRTSAPLTT